MNKKLLLILVAVPVILSGCASAHESYKNSGWYAPSGFSYTLQRDRETGDQSDYFGLNWEFK